MGRAERAARFSAVSCAFLLRGVLLAGLLVGGALLVMGCSKSAPSGSEQISAPASKACPAGYSVDPPRGVLEPGVRAFRDREYERAQAEFSALSQRYPESATARVWLADAILFDKALDGRVAAERSLPIYDAAGALHDAGCKLPRRPRYYHLMDAAYARLRLAQGPGGYDAGEVGRALGLLEVAMHEFPTSAEVPYTEARGRCALAQSVPPPADRAAAITECQHKFADALRLAGQLQRPRFLRTHRSMQDWIVRSRTQSEFDPLRESPEYPQIVAEALESSPLPIALPGGEAP